MNTTEIRKVRELLIEEIKKKVTEKTGFKKRELLGNRRLNPS